MKLIWKLLRKHISIPQFLGFFLSNLFGVFIVLFSIQFYTDVIPVLTQSDSFMKKEYLILSKKVGTLTGILGQSTSFSENDLKQIKDQPFTQSIGNFTASQFTVTGSLNLAGGAMQLTTQLFLESVPDEYVDVKLASWKFSEQERVIPIIVPKNYLNLYNYGFAESRNLPKISEGLVEMINLSIQMNGNGAFDEMKGKVVGFSNRLNTILVPQEFLKWANNRYAPNKPIAPSRVILEVDNPSDRSVGDFLSQHGYETEGEKLDSGKTAYFLKLLVGIVAGIGLLITLLSLFVLMLSIYLLLEKNSTKLQNLLLIGYTPQKVALPYQLLTLALNGTTTILSLFFILLIRGVYTDFITEMWSNYESGTMYTTCLVATLSFVILSCLNYVAIKQKVLRNFRNQ